MTIWSVPAHAIGLDECKSLEDDPKRLACYDVATGRLPTAAEKQAAKAEVAAENDTSGTGLVAKRETTPPGTKPSSLDERWDLDGRPSPALFSLRPYKPVYILPAFYSSSPTTHPTSANPDNDAMLRGPIEHLEGKFQISLKAKMLENVGFEGSNVWFGYTQSSRWQVYNHATSRPFRETDYEPEVIYSAPTHYSLFGLHGKLVGLSLTHQSNGRDLPQSRSWNRVIGEVGLENDDWTLLVRPWLRVREKAEKDDNPDILDYVGRGELIAIRKLGNQQIAVTLRHSLKGGDRSRGSIAVDWAFPLYGYLKGHVQLFSGYGESLIDYNHKQNSIGVGLSVGEWL
ncbi:MAG: phospholipase A [Burkholderiaceae bacterium]